MDTWFGVNGMERQTNLEGGENMSPKSHRVHQAELGLLLTEWDRDSWRRGVNCAVIRRGERPDTFKSCGCDRIVYLL